MLHSALDSQKAQSHQPPLPVMDSLEDGLTLTTRLDAVSVAEFIHGVADSALLLLVATEPGTSTYVLIVAPRDRLMTLWTRELHGILLCAANRSWIEAQTEASNLVPHGGNRPMTGRFFLRAHAAGLAAAIPDSPMTGRVGEVYRSAKCRELFCVTVHHYLAGELVPVSSESCSAEDSRRLFEAQRLIATRFSEKLTLSSIGRACGLNRTKLTSGFRELFNRTVASALSEERLKWAAKELRAGRLSVSQIAYSSGYLSHASFTRAFSKHYGVSPKDWRKMAEKSGSLSLSLC
jgi:AraC-like DNA-binding protein